MFSVNDRVIINSGNDKDVMGYVVDVGNEVTKVRLDSLSKSAFGLSKEYSFYNNRITLISHDLKRGDRVIALEKTYDNKRNVNKGMRPHTKGTVSEVQKFKVKVLLDGSNQEVLVGKKLLRRVDVKDKNKLVDFGDRDICVTKNVDNRYVIVVKKGDISSVCYNKYFDKILVANADIVYKFNFKDICNRVRLSKEPTNKFDAESKIKDLNTLKQINDKQQIKTLVRNLRYSIRKIINSSTLKDTFIINNKRGDKTVKFNVNKQSNKNDKINSFKESYFNFLNSEKSESYQTKDNLKYNFRLKKQGLVNALPNQYKEMFESTLLKFLKQNKVPTDNSNYVGIEIEMFSTLNRSELEQLICDKRLHKNLGVVTDGSIRPDDSSMQGFEIRLIAKQDNLSNILKRTCDMLSEIGARVNSSCGLHVHLDMRNRNVRDCFDRLYATQNLLYSSVDSMRRDNRYCTKVTSYSNAVSIGHYAGLNASSFDSKQTLEVRLHEGSIDFEKINNWVEILVKIIETPNENNVTVNTKEELYSLINMTDEQKEIFNKRFTA